MKITTKIETEIHPRYVRCVLPFDDEDDVAADFPTRTANDDKYYPHKLDLLLDIDARKVVGWPEGRNEGLHIKPTDSGSYYLLDADMAVLAKREQDYVPSVVPGEYGDYFIADISGDGTTEGWAPSERMIRESFFREDD